ncbi:hypothetical protein BCR42DRAFT_387772 [Absidia repens]|uniref:Protein kinase domain-containing protein n=1 Tax=Absidia repens TaxID=90262 RepID=A0A1X2IVW7_9FUNG|nr:hypothetical protein BCR42DRAFT_387772 [Absidia repens]
MDIFYTSSLIVKLVDFALSSQITANFTKKNIFVGTPFWMAPEVIKQSVYDFKARQIEEKETIDLAYSPTFTGRWDYKSRRISCLLVLLLLNWLWVNLPQIDDSTISNQNTGHVAAEKYTQQAQQKTKAFALATGHINGCNNNNEPLPSGRSKSISSRSISTTESETILRDTVAPLLIKLQAGCRNHKSQAALESLRTNISKRECLGTTQLLFDEIHSMLLLEKMILSTHSCPSPQPLN